MNINGIEIPGLLSVSGGAACRPAKFADVPATGVVYPAPAVGTILPPIPGGIMDDDGEELGPLPARVAVNDRGETAPLLFGGAMIMTEAGLAEALLSAAAHAQLRLCD